MEEPVTIVDREVLKILAVDTRMNILKQLAEGARTPSDLGKRLNKSDATIVEHLDVMVKVGLVKKVEQAGKKWVFYTLTERGKGIVSSKSRRLVIILSLSLLALLSGSFGLFQTSIQSSKFLAESGSKVVQPMPSVSTISLFPQLYSYLSVGLVLLGVVGIVFYLVKRLKFKQGIPIKPLICFSILFVSLLMLANPIFAQEQTYWHSNDYYNIELSGSGNAFVVANINLESLSEKEVSSLTLQIPYTKVQIYKLAQEGGYWYPPCRGVCPYYEPKYYEPSFLNYTTETLADSTLIRMNLTYPIANNSQTNIYLIFSTPRIAKETFQGFEFKFRTVQDNNALTRYVGASITVPQNMELKGKPSFKIDYSPSELAASRVSSAKEFVSMIRYPYGGYQYSAQNLLPGESFTITGLYGENVFLLYLYEIIIGIAGLAIFLCLFYLFLYRKIRRMFIRRGEVEEVRRRPSFSFGRALVTGAFSGFIFVLTFFLLTYISSLISNGYYYWYQPTMQILFFLLDGIILLIALFGLPYYLYSRYSRSEGIVSAVISIITALLLLVVVSMLFPSTPPIYFAEQFVRTATETVVG